MQNFNPMTVFAEHRIINKTVGDRVVDRPVTLVWVGMPRFGVAFLAHMIDGLHEIPEAK